MRPTPDRVRETLFNWLQFSLEGRRCLDVFAGSGILGFEAASRGAAFVLLIEKNPVACTAIASAIENLAPDRFELQRGDAMNILATPPNQPYDIVFVDPPFHQGLVGATLQLLDSRAWVCCGSKIYVETEKTLPLEGLPNTWRILKSQHAGDVAYTLCEKE